MEQQIANIEELLSIEEDSMLAKSYQSRQTRKYQDCIDAFKIY